MNNDEQTRKMIEDVYDDSRDESLRTMMKDFYNRRMAAVVALVWTLGTVFAVAAVLCAVAFFRSEAVKDQIMYTAGFLALVQWLGLMKIFAWQMIHRNSIKREIKRLELRIAQMGGKP